MSKRMDMTEQYDEEKRIQSILSVVWEDIRPAAEKDIRDMLSRRAERSTFNRMADIADKSQERAIQAIQQNVELEEDAERYRWFRDKCDQDRRIEILEASEGIADLIDHHIDKGRCGL